MDFLSYLEIIMIKIVVDAFGGDNAPNEIVKGVINAINKHDDIHVILSGDETKINELLVNEKFNKDQISILDAKDVISNDESPTEAIRFKKDSSLVKALNICKEDDKVAGIISAGSTGAVLTGAFMKLGRIKGIYRPALCPTLPTTTGGTVCICDCGANMDCKSEYLEQFAMMGNVYLNAIGVKNPRIALLNVGTEDHKGDSRTKDVFAMLSENKGINFVGNMEARDLLTGDYDLIVTDGFAGNVLLKSAEGAVRSLLKVMKSEIKSSFFSKIGALFMRKTFKVLKHRFNYKAYGGAVLLGCKKLVIKAHGSSDALCISVCIDQMYNMAKNKLVDKIEKKLEIAGIGNDE